MTNSVPKSQDLIARPSRGGRGPAGPAAQTSLLAARSPAATGKRVVWSGREREPGREAAGSPRGRRARASHRLRRRLLRRRRCHGNGRPVFFFFSPLPVPARHAKQDRVGRGLLGNPRRASASAARLCFHPSPTSALRRRRRWGRVGRVVEKPRGGQESQGLSVLRPALPAKVAPSFPLAYCVLFPGRKNERKHFGIDSPHAGSIRTARRSPDSHGSLHSERNHFLSFTISKSNAKHFPYIDSLLIL